MDIGRFVKLCERAWALPILAALNDGISGRQAALITATGAGRTAFANSLDHLFDLGMIERNPGHGHPLRPEFRLTEDGKRAARMATVLTSASQSHQMLMRRSWTLPVLHCLRDDVHFGGIRAQLGGITDKALSDTLKRLEGAQLVRREVDAAARPPRPLYHLTPPGREISQTLSRYVQ